jgi:PAS domain S-box-containing protein
VVSSASDGIILQESTGKILPWNKTVERVFGVKAEEVLDHTLNRRGWRTIREDGSEFPEAEHPSVHTLTTGDPCKNVVMGVRNATTDQLSWININNNPLFREGEPKPYAVVISFSDITERKRAEEALMEGEKKYRLLINNANESIVVVQDGLLKFVNPMTLGLVGVDSEQELIERPFTEFVHPDDRTMVVENYRRRIANETSPSRYAFRVVTRDGIVKWVEINVALIEWQGKPATLNFFIDITERKRAEEALKDSEEKYRNLVERANDGITIIQDGIVRYANPALAEIWSGSVEEIVGRSFADFIDPDEIPKVVDRHQRRMANEFVMPMMYETILRRSDGTKIFAELNAGLITFQGTPADLVIIRDITERKVVEERLLLLLRFQNEMLDTASIWIDMFDAQGNTTFWNLAAERISGYSREEVLGHAKIWKWLYPDPEYRAKMIGDVTGILLNNQRVENFETVISLKCGGQRVISWHYSNFVDKDGKILGGIGIGVDITEKKEAENELKESKRRLADIVDFLPDATMVIDKNGKIMSWNQAIVNLTGVKAEDILGKGDYEYAIPFYGQRRPVLIDLVQKPLKELDINYSNIKRQGGVLVGEAYISNLKGEETYLHGTAAALYDTGGNIVGAIESIRDITDHKRAEEAFKAERDRAEQYLNTVEVIIVALDAEARITLLNRKGYQILGYEEGELIDRDWIKTCLHPQDPESVYEANRRIIAGEIDLFEYYESYILNKNGEERFIAWHTTVIKDRDGRIIGTLSSGEDITERRKTEERKLQLAAIVESSNDAILRTLLDGTITNCNKGAERIYGYTEDEIIGQPLTHIVSPERLDKVPQILERLTDF